MAREPKVLPWDRLPSEWKRQIRKFVPPDLFYLLTIGAEDLGAAVERISTGLAEVRRLFDENPDSLVDWVTAEQDAALARVPRELLGKEGQTIAFEWIHSPHRLPPEERELPPEEGETCEVSGADIQEPEGIKPREERWTHWANWKTASYFMQHEIEGRGLGTAAEKFGLLQLDGPLLVDSLPDDEDRNERAVRLAREWTAPGAEGREKYRLSRYVTGGPNIPGALALKVGYHIGVGKSSARNILAKGGYEHPDNLTWVKKPRA